MKQIARFGYSRVYLDAGLVFWAGKAAINADGANGQCGSGHGAYHPISSKGLDALANAGHPGNWWGVISRFGRLIQQSAAGPSPGFCVSTTALANPSLKESDPFRYVDSESAPFFVLPGGHNFGCTLGDLGFIVNESNKKFTAAFYGDVGPRDTLGEISIAAADTLGVPSSPRHGGQAHGIVYVLFPGLYSGWPLLDHTGPHWVDAINLCVGEYGGYAKIRANLNLD